MKGIKGHLNRLRSACVADMVMATIKKEKSDLRKKIVPTIIICQRKPCHRKDGVSMKNLHKKHILTYDACPRCNNAVEDREHLFFTCPAARRIWRATSIWP
nr:60S ribosomal protein L23-like [Aegilops tauschii subsp. strangulata]